MQWNIVILVTADVFLLLLVGDKGDRFCGGQFKVVIGKLISIWVVGVVHVALNAFEKAFAVAEPCDCSVDQRKLIIALEMVQKSKRCKESIGLTSKGAHSVAERSPGSGCKVCASGVDITQPKLPWLSPTLPSDAMIIL